MTRSVVISMLLVVISLAACNNTAAALPIPTMEGVGKKISVTGGGSYTDVSPAELQKMLANKDFTFVDVWSTYDGTIPGTDLFIHYTVFEKNLDKFPDKNARIVLYCLGGERSRILAETLVGLGYTNIYGLIGGLTGWEAAGLEVIH
jgi:rhodanese-related sulfurtransferase/predicted small secreted protein